MKIFNFIDIFLYNIANYIWIYDAFLFYNKDSQMILDKII